MPKQWRQPAYIAILIAVIIIVVLGIVSLVSKKNRPIASHSGSTSVSPGLEKYAQTLAKLKEMMVLPEEEPVVAQVQDADLLSKQQNFYEQAKNGDFLFLFPTALKAVLFREYENKIINSGPIYIQNQNVTNADAKEVQEPLTVELRNGSGIKGYAKVMQDQIQKDDPAKVLMIKKLTTASKDDYRENSLIDLSKGKLLPSSKQEMERYFKTSSTQVLPEGEAGSTADILIILGTEK